MNRRSSVLLTDEQIRTFIAEGFLILHADFSESFHRSLLEQLDRVYEQEGNPGNNLLPRIRELQQVFDHPVVTGALTSVLGPNYMMHAHRYGHLNANPEAGGWHNDSYWGYYKMRHHHTWWAMLMYFPQNTPVELGPTSVVPGTHLYETRQFASEGSDIEALAAGPAGTFALIHFDIWHRSTPNLLGRQRYMLKFEFTRTEMPTAPSWDSRSAEWRCPASVRAPVAAHEHIWEEHWHWLNGKPGSIAGTILAGESRLAQLSADLEHGAEPVALNAAYELARCGQPGVRRLLAALRHERPEVSRTAAYGLSVAGADAVAGLTEALGSGQAHAVKHAVFALGELREFAVPAVPALAALLDNPSAEVRRELAETFGMIRPADMSAVLHGLAQLLKDSDRQVRFLAALAFCRVGPDAAPVLPQLEAALQDDNRYVRAHIAEALCRIGTPEVKDKLIHYLLTTRWDPSTTVASPYYP